MNAPPPSTLIARHREGYPGRDGSESVDRGPGARSAAEFDDATAGNNVAGGELLEDKIGPSSGFPPGSLPARTTAWFRAPPQPTIPPQPPPRPWVRGGRRHVVDGRINPTRGTVEDMRRRIDAGPPRS